MGKLQSFKIFKHWFLLPILTVNLAKSNQQQPCDHMNALLAWNFLCWIGYLFTFSLPLGFRQWTICREVLCYSVIWLNFNPIPKCNLISIWNPMSIVVSIYIPISILVLQNPTIIIHQTLLYSLLLQSFRNFCHKSVSRAFYWHGQVVAVPHCCQYFVLVIFASFLYSDWHKIFSFAHGFRVLCVWTW